MATELGVGYLSVLPDLSQLGKLVSKGMTSAGAAGAKAFGLGASKNLGGVTQAFGAAGKDAGEALAKQALAAAKSDISKLSKQMATATDAQAGAVGRLRVAQAKLAEVQGQAKPKASALAAAEEAVATAQRKATSATSAAESVTKKLADAQGRAKTAALDVAKAQSIAGGKAGNAFTQSFKSGFRPQDAVTKALGQAQKGADRQGRKVASRFGLGFNGAIGSVVSRSAGVFAAGFASIQLGGFLKTAITQASDLGETTSKVAQIFGPAAGEIQAFSATSGTALGQTRQQALDANATFGIFGKSAGLRGKELSGFTTELTTLATDLASFNNTTPEQAIEAIGAALRGESEPIRSYGVLLDDASLRQEALSQGLIRTTKQALTPQQKVLSAQALIMKQTTTQQGDFARTSEGLANQQRILSARFSDFKTTIGAVALPLATRFFGFLNTSGLPAVQGISARVKGLAGSLRGAFSVAPGSGFVSFLLGLRAVATTVFTEVTGGIRAFTAAFKANDGDITSSGLAGFMERLGQTTRSVFDGLRNDVLPVVVQFARNLREDLLPPAVAVGGRLAILAGILVTAIGPAFLAVTGFISGNATAFQSLAIGVGAIVVAMKGYQLALATTALVGKGVLVFTKAYAVAQGILNTVMSANPIALVVLALVGLAAGLVYAYKNSETFRNIVNGVFSAVSGAVLTAVNFVRDNWKLIIGILGGPLVAAVLLVTTHWDKIKAIFSSAVDSVVGALRTAWSAVVGAISGPLNAVIGFVTSVWSRVYPLLVLPVYIAIGVVKAHLGAIAAAFTAAKDWVVGAFAKAWDVVSGVLSGPINTAKTWIAQRIADIRLGFTIVKDWVIGTFAKAWSAVTGKLTGPIDSAKATIGQRITDIRTGFTAVKDWVVGAFATAWATATAKLTGPISSARDTVTKILGSGKGGIQAAFSAAVSAVSRIWDGLQEIAKKPIRFIIQTVLNGLIGAFNFVAGKFDAPTIAPIPMPAGFSAGGQFDGRLPGAPSAVDNMLGMTSAGPVGLATGEYIVNARDTARNLPLLERINSGQGFADGGLFGTLKSAASSAFTAGKSLGSDVLGFLDDPAKWLRDRLAGPLGRLSELGSSPVAQVVKAVPRSLVSTVSEKAKSLLGLGGGGPINAGLAGVLQFVRSQVGKPYIWGGVGPAGYDCSGLISAAINVALGRNPYQRLGATGSMPWSVFAPGPGAFNVGWFKGNPGHTAATVNGVNIESRGGRGTLMGAAARGANSPLFTNRMHVRGFANGGIVGDGPFDELDPRGKSYRGKALVPRSAIAFDTGEGVIPTGYSTVFNGTGAPEPLARTDRPWPGGPINATFVDADGVLIGTMRGVVNESGRFQNTMTRMGAR